MQYLTGTLGTVPSNLSNSNETNLDAAVKYFNADNSSQIVLKNNATLPARAAEYDQPASR